MARRRRDDMHDTTIAEFELPAGADGAGAHQSCTTSGSIGLVARKAGYQQHERVGLLIFFLTVLFSECARADPSIEFSGATSFGAIVAGVTSGRFAISPSASVSVRGEYGFFVVRDTLSFLGIAGGRFGISNETSVGGGLYWDLVNVSAGLSLAALSLPICGPRLCGQVRALAPGATVRLDIFGPFLSEALGISFDCAADWILGGAAPVWSGVSVRCSAGPIFRFTIRR
jgi:hypothetical protein